MCMCVPEEGRLVVDASYTLRDNNVLSECDNDEQLPAQLRCSNSYSSTVPMDTECSARSIDYACHAPM